MVKTEFRMIIFFSIEDGAASYNQQKKRPGADCGSDPKLFIAEFTGLN